MVGSISIAVVSNKQKDDAIAWGIILIFCKATAWEGRFAWSEEEPDKLGMSSCLTGLLMGWNYQ